SIFIDEVSETVIYAGVQGIISSVFSVGLTKSGTEFHVFDPDASKFLDFIDRPCHVYRETGTQITSYGDSGNGRKNIPVMIRIKKFTEHFALWGIFPYRIKVDCVRTHFNGPWVVGILSLPEGIAQNENRSH